MSDNNEKLVSKPAEQLDLVHQQKELFRELSREQTEAEKSLQEDQEKSAKGNSPAENAD